MMSFYVMRPTQPNHVKRTSVVIMVSVGVFVAADKARRSNQCSALNSARHDCMSRSLFWIFFFPSLGPCADFLCVVPLPAFVPSVVFIGIACFPLPVIGASFL